MRSASSEDTIISTINRRHSFGAIPPSIEKPEEIEVKASQPKLFTWSIIILCSIFYLFFFEEVVVTYLASFSANIDLHLSKSRGAFLTSMFNLSNVIGKALSIVLAIKLRHFTMLYMNLAIIVISLVILMIFSNTSLVMLWVGFCLLGIVLKIKDFNSILTISLNDMLGVGLSSIIASLYALMESVLTMDAMVSQLFYISNSSIF